MVGNAEVAGNGLGVGIGVVVPSGDKYGYGKSASNSY